MRWPGRSFPPASSSVNQPARSTSGNDCLRPLFGGHSISKLLLWIAATSSSPSASEGDDALAARLDGPPQGLQLALQRDAELLRELAPGGGFRVLAVAIFAFRDRPGAGVLLGPERPAGVDEEDAEAPRPRACRGGCRRFSRPLPHLTRVVPGAPQRGAVRRRPGTHAHTPAPWVPALRCAASGMTRGG